MTRASNTAIMMIKFIRSLFRSKRKKANKNASVSCVTCIIYLRYRCRGVDLHFSKDELVVSHNFFFPVARLIVAGEPTSVA